MRYSFILTHPYRIRSRDSFKKIAVDAVLPENTSGAGDLDCWADQLSQGDSEPSPYCCSRKPGDTVFSGKLQFYIELFVLYGAVEAFR